MSMKSISQIFAVASMTALVWSCSPIVDTRGHIEDEDITKSVIPQTTTQDEVLKEFGSPSSISTFGPETWYYISARKERMAFLQPKVVDQHVTEIEFGGDGVVRRIQSYSRKDGKVVDIASARTPSEGHQLGFFEQIMSNLGRFNKKKDDSGGSGAGAPRKPTVPGHF